MRTKHRYSNDLIGFRSLKSDGYTCLDVDTYAKSLYITRLMKNQRELPLFVLHMNAFGDGASAGESDMAMHKDWHE